MDQTDIKIVDVSGMSYFSPQQMDLFESIGISGDLFKEILFEYKKQGRTVEEMKQDLLDYQFSLEQQIQKENKKRRKHHHKSDKKKHKKKKVESEYLEERDTEKQLKPVSVPQEIKMELNFDEDELEESVFVEKFKIQDRSPAQQKAFHSKPSQPVQLSPNTQPNTRFSISFAEEPSMQSIII